jgi:hypothetical protein
MDHAWRSTVHASVIPSARLFAFKPVQRRTQEGIAPRGYRRAAHLVALLVEARLPVVQLGGGVECHQLALPRQPVAEAGGHPRTVQTAFA